MDTAEWSSDQGDGNRYRGFKPCFARLPEDCISVILSFTTPLDTVRSSSISKGFRSAADSDAIWEKFIPSDYREIISRISDPIHQIPSIPFIFSPKNNSTLSFLILPSSLMAAILVSHWIKGVERKYIWWLQESSYFLGLIIHWVGNADITLTPTITPEVITTNYVPWLGIRGKIETGMLSKRSNYAAYLVFNFEDDSNEFEQPTKSLIRFLDSETNKKVENSFVNIYLGGSRDECVFRHGEIHEIIGNFPKNRADGWMELEIGSFYNDHGDEAVVEVRLIEIKWRHGKSGLIIEGIEFRPN